MHPIAGLLLSYLLGSIPFAYLAGKLTRGIDLRQYGSGNLGATNVYRVLGAKWAAIVLLLDAAKGAVPVMLFPEWTTPLWSPPDAWDTPGFWAIAYGVAAIVGHVRPVFLLWQGGGKGVATAAGVFFGLAPLAWLISVVIWLAVVLASGYVSLASIAAAISLPVAVFIIHGARTPVLAVSIVVALFVVWTHRANIGRLRRGEEQRFGKKRPPAGGEAPVERPPGERRERAR